MNINREELLTDLTLVKGGLSVREFIEQASCFCFQDGFVVTFNDEVACRKKVGLKITGAVQSAPLLAILGKLEDEELEVSENANKELEFRGKRKIFALTKEAEVFLPIDRVEVPDKWRDLPKAFIESLAMVQHCVSKDHSRFLLTCIHVHPDYMESCDNHQAIRCQLEMPIKESILVRGTSLEPLTQLGVDQFALTKAWLHFKNQQGLVYSCRRYIEDYPDLGKLFEGKGPKVSLPKGLVQATERAQVFSADKLAESTVLVTLSDDTIQVVGQGASGWYKERKKIRYQGAKLEFLITPELLAQVSDKYEEAILLPGKLKVKSEGWVYATILSVPTEAVPEDEEQEGDDEDAG